MHMVLVAMQLLVYSGNRIWWRSTPVKGRDGTRCPNKYETLLSMINISRLIYYRRDLAWALFFTLSHQEGLIWASKFSGNTERRKLPKIEHWRLIRRFKIYSSGSAYGYSFSCLYPMSTFWPLARLKQVRQFILTMILKCPSRKKNYQT